MTRICTAIEVFDFMGTGAEERTGNTTMIETLIDNVTDSVERAIGRKLSNTSFTIKVHEDRYCSISGPYLFLKGIYHDIVSISSLKENGVALVEDTDFFITIPGVLERIDACWSPDGAGRIEIAGICGLVTRGGTSPNYTYTPYADLKQIVIEATAVKSGLWAKNVSDGDGNDFTILKQNLPKITIDSLKSWRNPMI